MKINTIRIAIVAILTISVIAAFLDYPRIRNTHEADFAIRWGKAIAISQQPFTPETLPYYRYFITEVDNLIKEDLAIRVARDKAIRLGNTEGLADLVTQTVCKHFNIQPIGYPIGRMGPTPISAHIANIANTLIDLLVSFFNAFLSAAFWLCMMDLGVSIVRQGYKILTSRSGNFTGTGNLG
jgi:hypothetical protein